MDHRKAPASKALTLPLWIIVLSALICLGAASYLGVVLLRDNSSGSSAKPTRTQATVASTTTPTTETTTPEPTETTRPTPKPKPTAAPVQRNIPVGVFNNTSTTGLARTVAARVRAAGWTVDGTGNWRGSIPQTTVYYPPGFQTQAQTLANDLDLSRVRPSVAPMQTDRLTLILAGPQ
ncbi:LytR C-terminal domain-containing protein [Aeromicrobium sp.]